MLAALSFDDVCPVRFMRAKRAVDANRFAGSARAGPFQRHTAQSASSLVASGPEAAGEYTPSIRYVNTTALALNQ